MDPLQIVLHVVVGVVVAIFAVIVLLHVLYAILWFGPHFWLPLDKGGDPDKGLAIWVDPIRFLGGHWGERTSAYGLRQAGFQGQFRYWKWHSWLRGTLVLPAMMDRTFIERKAGELAEFITARRDGKPVQIEKGDLVTFPKGMSCTWKIVQSIRKHYAFK